MRFVDQFLTLQGGQEEGGQTQPHCGAHLASGHGGESGDERRLPTIEIEE
jgi:hypothetical protein